MAHDGADELTPREVARLTGTSLRTVQRWIATGRLPARRVGGRWRVASGAIDAPRDGATPRSARIRRVFVANRGEIGARIERTCVELDVAVHLPERDGPVDLDLLDERAVVRAARRAGADAVHPGYGFLAEQAGFAEAVLEAGMRWIGPSPAAMRRLGDKASARRLARDLGIPVVDGYEGDDQSDRRFLAEAVRIGLPVLVKPAAGGGGKGMHLVESEPALVPALGLARREAGAAFGDSRLILERLVEHPRHVEVQVLFDRHGAGVHLGSRDCSIQRRHQKILEEAPAPHLPATTRDRLTSAALRLASAVGYESAGTVEFLVDADGAWYFIEMNTRLQVEHPVTELTWGRDLVADQLRIAAGDTLGLRQREIRSTGHAFEARIYAEDPDHQFLPTGGVAALVSWPAGEDVRIDTGLVPGTLVGDRFDPLLAKIVVHGRTRAHARRRLRVALEGTTILGLTTNLHFLRWLVDAAAVVEGRALVDTIESTWRPADWATRASIPDSAWEEAARRLLDDGPETGPWGDGWRPGGRATVRIAAEDAERTISVGPGADGHRQPHPAVSVGGVVHVDVGGRSIEFRIAAAPDVDRSSRAAATREGGGPAEVRSPMPGRVLAVHVAMGAPVGAGDRLVTLEAMKMEHDVVAPLGGRLTDLPVAAGDQVERGRILVVIAP